MTCDAPLYILPHSKAVLKAAIHNDTEFLSMQSVMDYSLLVGLDSENRELVLGIIGEWQKLFLQILMDISLCIHLFIDNLSSKIWSLLLL